MLSEEGFRRFLTNAGDVIETGRDSTVSIVKLYNMSFLGADSRAVFDGSSAHASTATYLLYPPALTGTLRLRSSLIVSPVFAARSTSLPFVAST